ncbi:MAG: response regulator [Deltaproteobacteria bacterium]|nr:response regulator [Deltaproteobacteria bacterium]
MDKTIMVVNDNYSVRSMLAYTLVMEHYGVLAARDGIEAINKINEGLKPDLVIAELEMPGLDGVALTRMIRATPDTYNIPVLITASEFKLHKQMEWKDAGVTSWLVKPFTADQLLKTVRMVTF